MADQEPAAGSNGSGNVENEAQVSVLAQYVKDLSVENPSAPQVYSWQVQPQLAPHAVSWYRAHPDEMQRDYSWCRDNPGIHDPNCAAAAEAKLQADFDAFVKAPR